MKPTTPTRSATAYEALTTMIRTKQILPGDFLSENSVARDLAMSRTPVREAIRRLAQEGALVVLPNRGVVVAQLTVEDLEEIYEVREVLEGLASRNAAIRATPEVIGQLESLVERMRETIPPGDENTFSDLDMEFHATIAGASGNSRLKNLLAGMRTANAVAHFRPDFRPHNPRTARSLEEHAELLAAIRDRDPETADRLARAHSRAAVRDFLLYALSGADAT
jgi:DNA-binding GntR family transcriptional regulator